MNDYLLGLMCPGWIQGKGRWRLPDRPAMQDCNHWKKENSQNRFHHLMPLASVTERLCTKLTSEGRGFYSTPYNECITWVLKITSEETCSSETREKENHNKMELTLAPKSSYGCSHQLMSIFSVRHKVKNKDKREGSREEKVCIITWRGGRGKINERI